ncbi:Os07g0644900 [Oryza sativa Japonica Group]|uniref:Os07g0644900 protein n=1 Tax=Oryza sativa subsp. japonica TaxID=39947 RepID=Q0D459_ORYSJ|nr:Os07g0644900 [Oryza sativa Japonica Group]|eukprot:NP_001060450.2 Os07g0644900 [Oryza sativa Japonica Group]
MSTLTKAARSLLAVPQRETFITSLCLKLYLMGNYSRDKGFLLSEAIDGGIVKDLDLAILNEKEPEDCDDKDMFCQARVLKAFAGAFPRVLHFLTRLSVQRVIFTETFIIFCLTVALSWTLELFLACGAQLGFEGFMLSEVLQGTKDLHTLTIDFQGEKLWVQPEQKQFCPAFNNLKTLSILCVYVEFDLLWALNLLEAAPSVELLFIDTWEHICLVDQMDEEGRKDIYGERTHPSWEISEFTGTRKWRLKKLQFAGFRPLKQQLVFLKAIMDLRDNISSPSQIIFL